MKASICRVNLFPLVILQISPRIKYDIFIEHMPESI